MVVVMIWLAGLSVGSPAIATDDPPSGPIQIGRDLHAEIKKPYPGSGTGDQAPLTYWGGLLVSRPAVELGHEPPSAAGSQRANPDNGSKTAFDTDAGSSLSFQVTPEVSIGGKIDVEAKATDNDDLNRGTGDQLALFESKLSLAVLYQPAPPIELFAEGRVTYSNPLKDGTDKRNEETELDFREGYLLLRQFLADPISLQVGRQRFKDEREWFYDERLDAIRVVFETNAFTLDLSVSSTVVDPDTHEDKITNYIVQATYQYVRKGRVCLYGIAREDRSNKDRDPIFVGLSWRDRSQKTDQFWLDAAVLFGHDRSKDLLGYGIDAGWSHRFDHPLKPSVTLAYAFGSGDSDSKDNKDRDFQQTDLQDNSGNFFGNTKFSYYGEVVDPELSNMMIFTAGVGIAPSKRFSLDLVYHYYALVELTDELRDADIAEDLTGDDKDLGHAMDLIIGMKLAQKVRASFSTGVFLPGSAFPEDDVAYRVEFKIQFSF